VARHALVNRALAATKRPRRDAPNRDRDCRPRPLGCTGRHDRRFRLLVLAHVPPRRAHVERARGAGGARGWDAPNRDRGSGRAAGAAVDSVEFRALRDGKRDRGS
jgi:hypothetical protein